MARSRDWLGLAMRQQVDRLDDLIGEAETSKVVDRDLRLFDRVMKDCDLPLLRRRHRENDAEG